jgi:nicotinamide mononucleotide transporter
MKIIKDFNRFEKLLLLINMIVSIIIMIAVGDYNIIAWLGFFSSITNIICVILVAKRRISNYAWGTAAIITYTIVAFSYGHTAEWTFQVAYYLPMNFIGWFLWAKNRNPDDKKIVDSKKLNLIQSIFFYGFTLAGTLVLAWAISLPFMNEFFYGQVYDFGFDKYIVDASSDILAITAMILMVKRYREQWILWIIIDVIAIILWGFYTFDLMMLLQWSCMLANAIYGYMKWRAVKINGQI